MVRTPAAIQPRVWFIRRRRLIVRPRESLNRKCISNQYATEPEALFKRVFTKEELFQIDRDSFYKVLEQTLPLSDGTQLLDLISNLKEDTIKEWLLKNFDPILLRVMFTQEQSKEAQSHLLQTTLSIQPATDHQVSLVPKRYVDLLTKDTMLLGQFLIDFMEIYLTLIPMTQDLSNSINHAMSIEFRGKVLRMKAILFELSKLYEALDNQDVQDELMEKEKVQPKKQQKQETANISILKRTVSQASNGSRIEAKQIERIVIPQGLIVLRPRVYYLMAVIEQNQSSRDIYIDQACLYSNSKSLSLSLNKFKAYQNWDLKKNLSAGIDQLYLAQYYCDELYGIYSKQSLLLRLDLVQYHLVLIRLIEFKELLMDIFERCEQAIRGGTIIGDEIVSRGAIQFIEDKSVVERILQHVFTSLKSKICCINCSFSKRDSVRQHLHRQLRGLLRSSC